MSVDPIRAELDMAERWQMYDALRVVLDWCDEHEQEPELFGPAADIRYYIAYHLGVTDV